MKLNLSFLTSITGIITLVIILAFIITILLASGNARVAANDEKRILDITQIQAALKIYFDENGFYPPSDNNIPKSIETYLDFWPTAPAPSGNCNAVQNTYSYSQVSNGEDYSVSFCIGSKYQNLNPGLHYASRKGIE